MTLLTARVLALAVVLWALAPSGADAQWRRFRSDHFEVIGNASARAIRDVALRFEQFRDVLARLDPGAVAGTDDAPVRILAFRDLRSCDPFMPRVDGRRIPVAGMFVAGPDGVYLVVCLDRGFDSFRTVFHEYSHLLLGRVFANAPLWFNEGLAEYYSTLRISGARTATIGGPIAGHVSLLRQRSLPLERLFALTERSPEYTTDGTLRPLVYAQAWAVVHHALHGQPSRRDQLFALARRLAAGGDLEASVRETYGLSVAELDREVQTYVGQRSYKATLFTFRDDLRARVGGEVTRVSDGEAGLWLADLLAQMGRDEEARERLAALVAEHPDLAERDDTAARLLRTLRRAADADATVASAGTGVGEPRLAATSVAGPRGFALGGTPGGERAARPPGARPRLRIPLAGEERALGTLDALECSGDVVAFIVSTPQGAVRATSRFSDVQVISYRDGAPGEVLCGAQQEPLPILLTWRASGDLRYAIAVEFLPDDFVP